MDEKTYQPPSVNCVTTLLKAIKRPESLGVPSAAALNDAEMTSRPEGARRLVLPPRLFVPHQFPKSLLLCV